MWEISRCARDDKRCQNELLLITLNFLYEKCMIARFEYAFMPSPYRILFPKEISASLCGLWERRLLTPSFFSAIAMLPIFPKQFDQSPYMALSKENLDAGLRQRYITLNGNFREYSECDQVIRITHTIHLKSNNGIERLDLIANQPSSQYVIHFPGNNEDAMNLHAIADWVKHAKFGAHNHVFWNYPGVESDNKSISVYELFAAGLQQVQDLIRGGVPVQNITFYGRSLGGGIASQVASRLPQNDYRPNLEIERSFASISAVPFVAVRELIDPFPRRRPFYSAVIAFSLLGLSSGLITAGFISTIGLLCATVFATIGYVLAQILQLVRTSLEWLSFSPNVLEDLDKVTEDFYTKLSGFALMLHQHIFSVLASIIGMVVGITGIIAGALLGVGVGGILALQTLVTDNPWVYFPLRRVFKLLAFVAHAEIDSVAAIRYIVDNTEHAPTITSTNVENDKVIPPKASLNYGLDFRPEPDRDGYSRQLSFFWFKSGGHNDPINDLSRFYQVGM